MESTSPRSILHAIGGPYAVTALAWLLLLVPSMLPNVVYDRAINGGSLAGWALVGFSGTFVGGIVYLGIGRILLPRRQRPSRPVTAICVFGIAGVVRGLTIGALSVELGLAESPQWVFRATGGAALGIAWSSLAAVVVDAWIGHRDALRDLERRRRQTIAVRQRAIAELESTRQEIRDTLVAQVSAILALLSTAIRQGTDASGARTMAHRLHSAVQDVVRPLSHSLATRESIDTVILRDRRDSLTDRIRSWVRTITADALTIDPYHPALTALVIVPSSLPAAVRDFGLLPGVLGALTIGGIVWLGLRLARRISIARPRQVGRWSWLPTLAVYAAVGGLSALVPAAAAAILDQSALVGWHSSGQSLLILVPIAALGAAFFAAEDRRRSIVELERGAEVAQAEWTTNRVEQELWAANHRLARQLHGTVQSQLTAAALRLESWAMRPDPITLPGVLDQVNQALADVVVLLDEQSQVRDGDPEGAVAAVTAVWSGVARTTISFDNDALSSIASDSATNESVVEIVRECVSNAIRHGRARAIVITVGMKDASSVAIVIDDDGRGAFPSAPPGLGSALLDQVCLSWDREPRGASSGTRVRALVAVSPEQPVALGAVHNRTA